VIPSPRATDIRLGERDRELLVLVARGMSTNEIAHALFLAPKTVRNRLSDLYRVLGVANRAEAVAVAYEFRDVGTRSTSDRLCVESLAPR
jgi:DNA-binding NarL/FixJ family response regulator